MGQTPTQVAGVKSGCHTFAALAVGSISELPDLSGTGIKKSGNHSITGQDRSSFEELFPIKTLVTWPNLFFFSKFDWQNLFADWYWQETVISMNIG